MSTFVLVPGAWCDGSYWAKLTPLLRQVGHDVFTPTLTGVGQRAHLAGPGVNLSTHVQDIVGLVQYEDLADVILVGHSYAGMVITGVAQRIPERLNRLVYLDAFVPTDGQSLMDITNPDPTTRGTMEEWVKTEGQGWARPRLRPDMSWDEVLRTVMAIDNADIPWLLRRLTPHPYATLTEPVQRVSPAAEQLPRTYIRAAQLPHPFFDRFAADARAPDSGWDYRELPTTHMVMVTMPRELADLLLESA